MAAKKYTKVTRDRFSEGYDAETDVRRTKIGKVKKTSEGEMPGLIFQIELPVDCTPLKVPAKGDRPTIHYNLHKFPINDGYVSINDLTNSGGGQTIICRGDVKRKVIRNKSPKTFTVYYLKIVEVVDEAPTHIVRIAPHDLALEDILKSFNDLGDAVIFELSTLNDNHQGGIIVKPL